MSRFINALLIFLMVLSAAAVYDMKYEAELAAADVVRLEREVEQQRATISLLKAEWSMLSQPKRLQTLVEHHHEILKLQPLTADGFGTLADIPAKPVEVTPLPLGPGPASPAAPTQRSAAAAPVAGLDGADDPLDDLIDAAGVMVQ